MSTNTNLAPISNRHYHHTFIGGPGSGRTRRECWAAETADGRWYIERLDGEPGTPWQILLLETGETIGLFGTLKSARMSIASGRADEALLLQRVSWLFDLLAFPVRRSPRTRDWSGS